MEEPVQTLSSKCTKSYIVEFQIIISSENLDRCDISKDELLINSIMKSLSLTLSRALSVMPSNIKKSDTNFLSSL